MRVRSFVIDNVLYCIVSDSGRNPFFNQHVNAHFHNDVRPSNTHINHMILYLLDVNPTIVSDITEELKPWFTGYLSLDGGVHMLSVRIDSKYWITEGLKLENKIVLSRGEGQYSLDVGKLASSIITESRYRKWYIQASQLEILPSKLPF